MLRPGHARPRRDGTRITVLDKLTYAGNRANLAPVEADPEQAGAAPLRPGRHRRSGRRSGRSSRDADAVVNFAAESHVDRSILDPEAFLRTGVDRRPRPARGRRRGVGGRSRRRPLPPGLDRRGLRLGRGAAARSETDRLAPRSPYSAAKAAGELLVGSYVTTHGVDAVVTRGSNTYGPYHHPEKLIPLFVTNAIDDQPLPLYGDGLQQRDWLYVADHAGAIEHVLRHGADRRDVQHPGLGGDDEPRRRRGAPRAARQAVVARPERAGPARPRSALRAGRLEAGGARLAEPDVVRRRPGGDDRLVPRERGVVAGREVRRLGRLLRAPVRVTPGHGQAVAESALDGGLTGARRRHRRRRAARAGARRGARGRAVHGPRPGRSPGTGPTSTSTLPSRIHALLDRDRPEAVVHAAAWTDVDGCARDPELALAGGTPRPSTSSPRRRPHADIDLVHVSTNEVFDGRRTDGRGYAPDDRTNPINPYGASKLDGEIVARPPPIAARRRRALGIVRTAWLYGPPGNDFPSKILAAAERARIAGEPLRVVGDEFGSPTFTHDLAEAIVELLGSGDGRRHPPRRQRGRRLAGRLGAGAVHGRSACDVAIEEVPASTWPRASTPPAWGVLEPTPLPGGEPLRPWHAALADYLPTLLRQRAAARAASGARS